MAPLLAMLAQSGLSLLAGAVRAKGQEFIEEKVGIRPGTLGDMLATDEGRVKLAQIEFENEKMLRDFAIRMAENDLAGFKVEVEDRQGARSRDVELAKAGLRNDRANAMFLLAIVMIAVLVYIVWKDETINEYVKGIFTLVLGRFLGYLDNIYNFEFGTTRGSRDKDSTIDQLSKGGGR